MILNESLNISKDPRIPFLNKMLLAIGLHGHGDQGKFPHEHKWDNEKSFYPFDKFVATVRFEMVFYAVSRCH
jgi:hypothetical protein